MPNSSLINLSKTNRRIRWASLFIAFLVASFLVGVLQASEPFPRLEGEDFLGAAKVLPDAVKGHPALLIVSFSRKAKAQTTEWGKQLTARRLSTSGFTFLHVPVLEDVPRLFRGMVKGSMKKGIPQDVQQYFVLLFQGEEKLKQLTGYQKDDEAYLLLLDASGNIQWRDHGIVNDEKISRLSEQLQKLELVPSKKN